MNFKSLFFLNKGILKNTFWLGLAETISKLIGFLIIVWMARAFGPEIYGKWAFALSFVIIFSVFSDFGLSALTVREIARDKSKTQKYLNNIVTMKLILGIAALGLIAFFVNFLGKDSETVKLVYFLGIYIVINTFAAFFESIFRANEKMRYEAICRISQSILLLLLASFFIFGNFPILNVSYAYISAALFGTVLSLVFVWRHFSKFFLSIDIRYCKKLLLNAWPFGFSVVAIFLYNYFDQVMLGIIRTNREVGLYSASFRIILALSVAGDILGVAFFPRLSKLYKENLEKLKHIARQFLEAIYFFILPVAFGGAILSSQILSFFYGKDYIEGAAVFRILVLNLIALFLSIAFGDILKASDKQKSYLFGIMLGMVLNIILNLVLIPWLGIAGAAIATFLAQISIFGYLYIKVWNLIGMNLFFGLRVPLISSLVMGGCVYFLFLNFNLIFVVFLGACVYFLSYFLFSRILVLDRI